VHAIHACGRAAANATLAFYDGLTTMPTRGPLAANTVAGTSAERALVSNIESQRSATTSALVFDWIMAQVKAGVVSSPGVLSTPLSATSR